MSIDRIGPYSIVDRLGGGGMADVYRASDESGAHVAVKLYRPGVARLERVEREREIGELVEHPAVVRLLDSGSHTFGRDECPYLVFELVEGKTLKELVAELGQVPEALCRRIARDTAVGLAAIHEAGITHRDIKPANIMITSDDRVRILDFGVAALEDASQELTQTGVMLGTPRYAAPEQAAGRDAGVPADLWALGATLYELAVGRPYREDLANGPPGASSAQLAALEVAGPSDQTLERSVDPLTISPFYFEVLDNLLAHDPEERIQAADATASIIDQGAGGEWYRDRAARPSARALDPRQRLNVDRNARFAGRAEELATLRSHFDAATAGAGRAVLVLADGGMGKSRVLDEFLRQHCDPRECSVLVASARDDISPGGILGAAVASYFPRNLLGQRLRELLPDRLRLADMLVEHLRGEVETRMDGAAARAGLVRAIRALAGSRPAVVVVDDLHEADEEDLQRFRALARVIANDRVLLLGAARPSLSIEYVADVSRLGHATILRLGGLEESQLHDLLGSQKLQAPITWADRRRLHALSGGSPYMALELAAHHDAGQSTREPSVPTTLRDVLEVRLARLADADRELLEYAACAGHVFDPQLLAEARAESGSDEEQYIEIVRQLSRLQRRRGPITSRGGDFTFSHQLLRDHLYTHTAPAMRSVYHGRLGRALLQRSMREDADAELTVAAAEHLLRSGTPDDAQPLAGPAIRHLLSRFEHERAYSLSRLHLEASKFETRRAHAHALLTQADVLHSWGRSASAAEPASEALRLATDSADRGLQQRAHVLLGTAAMAAGELEEAGAQFELAAGMAWALDEPAAACDADVRAGLAAIFLGNHEGARRLLQRAAENPASHERPQLAARARGNLAMLARDESELTVAISALRQLDADHGGAADPQLSASVAGNLAHLLHRAGDNEAAEAQARKALEGARQVGNQGDEASALAALDYFTRSRGALLEAREYGAESVQLARIAGDLRAEAFAHVNCSDTLRDLGEHDLGLAAVNEALAIGALAEGEVVSQAIVNKARLLTAMGRAEEAIDLLEKRRSEIYPAQASEADWVSVVALTELGDVERARESAAAHLRGTAGTHTPLVNGWAVLLGVTAVPFDETSLAEALSALPLPEQVELAWVVWKNTGNTTHLRCGQEALMRVTAGLDPNQRAYALEGNDRWGELHSQP